MPSGIVDPFEAIQVDDHHGERLVVTAGAPQRVLQAIVEQGPVAEPSQRVMEREVRELCLQLLAPPNV